MVMTNPILENCFPIVDLCHPNKDRLKPKDIFTNNHPLGKKNNTTSNLRIKRQYFFRALVYAATISGWVARRHGE
jgi:hypothetical protein